MKKITFCGVAVRKGALAVCSAGLAVLLTLGAAPMMAQGGGGGGRGMMNPQTQLDAMTSQLGLTADQQPKVLAVLQDTQKKMMDIRNSGADPSDMRPKMMALRTEQQEKIKALLTDEQKPKYDAMIQAQMNRMRGGQGAPPAGASPAGGPPQQ